MDDANHITRDSPFFATATPNTSPCGSLHEETLIMTVLKKSRHQSVVRTLSYNEEATYLHAWSCRSNHDQTTKKRHKRNTLTAAWWSHRKQLCIILRGRLYKHCQTWTVGGWEWNSTMHCKPKRTKQDQAKHVSSLGYLNTSCMQQKINSILRNKINNHEGTHGKTNNASRNILMDGTGTKGS